MGCYNREKSNTFGFVGWRRVVGVSLLADLPNIDVCPISLFLGAPSALGISNVTTDSLQLDWTSNSAGEETGFGIERSLTGIAGSFSQIATTLTGIVTYTDIGLANDTTYYYRVRAFGSTNSPYSNIESAKTPFVFIFSTNMIGTGTFDPSIAYSGADIPTWEFSDGSKISGVSISTLGSAVGLDGTTQSVKLVIADKTLITNFIAGGDSLVGAIDFSVFVGATFDQISVHVNQLTSLDCSVINYNDGFIILGGANSLTSFVINTSSTADVGEIDVGSNSLVSFDRGNLVFVNTTKLQFDRNNLTTFLLQPSDTLFWLLLNNNLLTSIPNLSQVDFIGYQCRLVLSSNPSLSEPLPISPTGEFSFFELFNTGYSGTLDISSHKFANEADIRTASTLIDAILFPNMVSGSFRRLYIDNTPLTGIVDISGIIMSSNSGQIRFDNNIMTSILLPSFTGANFFSIDISGSNLSGIYDFSSGNFSAASEFGQFTCSNQSGITGFVLGNINKTRLINIQGTSAVTFDISILGTTYSEVNNFEFNAFNCGATSAEVNKWLVDLDASTSAGFTGRIILVHGTNASPDGTSGGLDGTTAAANLVAKGFTVTTS